MTIGGLLSDSSRANFRVPCTEDPTATMAIAVLLNSVCCEVFVLLILSLRTSKGNNTQSSLCCPLAGHRQQEGSPWPFPHPEQTHFSVFPCMWIELQLFSCLSWCSTFLLPQSHPGLTAAAWPPGRSDNSDIGACWSSQFSTHLAVCCLVTTPGVKIKQNEKTPQTKKKSRAA